jgi:hypothetical protein
MQWRVRGATMTRAQRKQDRDRFAREAVVRAKPAPAPAQPPPEPPAKP